MIELPLFPLNTVLFPGMPVQLRIFEPRYHLMVRRCLEANQPFGVVLIRQGQEALGPLAEPYPVGCTARIVEIDKQDNGDLKLTALGDEPFRIKTLNRDRPYLVGQLEILHLQQASSPTETQLAAHNLNNSVKTYLGLLQRNGHASVGITEIEMPAEPLLSIYLAASLLQLPTAEKQPLLALESTTELVQQVERLYKREISLLSSLSETGEAKAQRASWLN